MTQASFDCHTCNDEGGYLVKREDGIDVWKYCDCTERKRVKRLMAASQITEEFKKKVFSNFKVEGMPEVVAQAFKAARSYVTSFPEIKLY
ncbi:hypothetical protein ACFSTH_11720 [Paenibacillus yanchengensis]